MNFTWHPIARLFETNAYTRHLTLQLDPRLASASFRSLSLDPTFLENLLFSY